ncbi:MAG TPA: hypothetical protein DCE71_03640 [Parachlamydiales bacterium]|nr:hypothetical protein [Parachlamydiales bacterium]
MGRKHQVYDFLFTYITFSPAILNQLVLSFVEVLCAAGWEDLSCFGEYWFKREGAILYLNPERLQGQALALVGFIEELCQAVAERTPRFGCFGLHEWAMVYRLSQEEIRHRGCRLRLSQEKLSLFVESQHLCCTHYDAYRFFTPQAKPLNVFQPTLQERLQNEQSGCLHANMDLYKWATKLWPWIGSDLIAKTFLLAVEGRELDMRASPYDLREEGYDPICIETEEGRRQYQGLQQKYAEQSKNLRQELAAFCSRLRAWKKSC